MSSTEVLQTGAGQPADPRIRLVDHFNVHLVLVLGLVLAYRIFNGDDYPKNAFYSGVYLCLGMLVMNVSLRLNLSPESRFLAVSVERLLWEYLACGVVLLFFLVNLMG